MKCPKCSREMSAKVINDPFDGDLNLKICKCGYSRPIHQATPFEVLRFRSAVSQILEAA